MLKIMLAEIKLFINFEVNGISARNSSYDLLIIQEED